MRKALIQTTIRYRNKTHWAGICAVRFNMRFKNRLYTGFADKKIPAHRDPLRRRRNGERRPLPERGVSLITSDNSNINRFTAKIV